MAKYIKQEMSDQLHAVAANELRNFRRAKIGCRLYRPWLRHCLCKECNECREK